VALKEIYEDQNYSKEDDQVRFEQEISIMWGVSSHPNIITLVGYSENPRCIITKVFFFFFFFSFFFSFFFFSLFHSFFSFFLFFFFEKKKKKSCMIKTYQYTFKVIQQIFQAILY